MTVRVNGREVQREGGGASVGDIHGAGVLSVRVEGRPIAVIGQTTVGHAGFPPSPAVEGSSDVFVEMTGVVRAGDAYAPHSDGSSTHTDVAQP